MENDKTSKGSLEASKGHQPKIHASCMYISGQISIIPKPELRGFWGDSLTKPQFKVTSAEVVIICPDI